MRDIGYIEGENVVYEVRSGAPKELPALASELVRSNVDLMLCVSSAPVRAAMGVTRTVPIVALDLETDPVASGFAVTLGHPGGNLTGWFLDFPEFSAKQLEILKETLPALTQVMVLWDPAMERAPLSGFESASRRLHVRVFVREVGDASLLDLIFKDAVAKKVGAVLVMQSPTLVGYRRQIAKLAADFRLPLMGMFTYFTADGALLSYGPNVDDMYRRTTVYIDQILKGARPGDLPIRRPEKFDFVVNIRTARTLGVRLPQSVLARADEVIR
jgi:putative ABC transport system substrate-binding protein